VGNWKALGWRNMGRPGRTPFIFSQSETVYGKLLARLCYEFGTERSPELYAGTTWGGRMAVQYCIDPERRVVITSLAGVVSEEELLDLCSHLSNDPRFSAYFSQLIEVEQGASAVLHYSDLSHVRDKDPFSKESLRAIVVHSAVDFGNARMYEMLWGGQAQVFTSVTEAMEFLGLVE
jgi:hypothetical protein